MVTTERAENITGKKVVIYKDAEGYHLALSKDGPPLKSAATPGPLARLARLSEALEIRHDYDCSEVD